MAISLGNIVAGTTFKAFFNTHNASGTPTTLVSGAAAVFLSGTALTSGVTLTADYASGLVGGHEVVVDSSAYPLNSGRDYSINLTNGTVSGQTVSGTVIAHFSVNHRLPATGSGFTAIPSVPNSSGTTALLGYVGVAGSGLTDRPNTSGVTSMITSGTKLQSGTSAGQIITSGGIMTGCNMTLVAGTTLGPGNLTAMVSGIQTNVGVKGSGLTDLPFNTTFSSGVTTAVPTTAQIKTALEVAGGDLDLLVRTMVNKILITEATGNTELFSDAGVSAGTVAAAYTSIAGVTKREALRP